MKDYHKENKSFMLYKDMEEIVCSLDNDKDTADLFRALFAFASRGEEPNFSGAVKMAFIIIKNAIERDGKKWEEVCNVNAENGKKGGRPPKDKPDNQKINPTVFETTEQNQTEAKKADKDIDIDIDKNTDKNTDIDTDIYIDTDNEKDNDKVTEKETDCNSYESVSSVQSVQSVPLNNNLSVLSSENAGGVSANNGLTRFSDMVKTLSFDDKRPFGIHRNILLSTNEYTKLLNMSDEKNVKRYIDKASQWQYENPMKNIREPFDTISRWIRQDKF